MCALAIGAGTGIVAKACRRMSVKRDPQGNALKSALLKAGSKKQKGVKISYNFPPGRFIG